MGLLRRRREVDGNESGSLAPTESVPIGQAEARRPIVVTGTVSRMRARPSDGLPTLAVTVTDDTGSVVAVWTGRRAIGGVTLGRRIALSGVASRHGDQLELMNPAYTLLER